MYAQIPVISGHATKEGRTTARCTYSTEKVPEGLEMRAVDATEC